MIQSSYSFLTATLLVKNWSRRAKVRHESQKFLFLKFNIKCTFLNKFSLNVIRAHNFKLKFDFLDIFIISLRAVILIFRQFFSAYNICKRKLHFLFI